jgi:hypothetical protein
MLGASFDGLIINQHKFNDVSNNGYKYIHCDLVDVSGYMTITLTFGSSFVIAFSNMLYVGYFVKMSNFGVMAYNRLKLDVKRD